MGASVEKKKRTTLAKDYIGWEIYVIIQAFICVLPLRVAYWLASLAGELMCLFAKKNRLMVERNLRLGLGLDQRTIKKYKHQIFKNFCKNVVDFLRFDFFDEKWFKEYVEVVGRENMVKALSQGNGAIIISAHLGNYELAALMNLMCGFPMNAIWASHKNPRIEEFFVAPRIKKGIKVILTGGAMKKSLQALALNETVAFVIDYAYGGRGIEIEFFGRKTIIPKGVAIAALQCKVPIVPYIGVRKDNLKYKIVYGDAVKYNLTGEEEKDIKEILSQSVKAIEKYIREYPDQWVLFRDCWPREKSNSASQ